MDSSKNETDKVFIGDTVEVRYIFHSDVNLLFDDLDSDFSQLALSTDFRDFDALSDRCLVKSAGISRSASDYTLSLELVVWKTDVLDFPPFDLQALVLKSLPSGKRAASGGFWVDLEPIVVESIVKANGIASFMRHKPPMADLLTAKSG